MGAEFLMARPLVLPCLCFPAWRALAPTSPLVQGPRRFFGRVYNSRRRRCPVSIQTVISADEERSCCGSSPVHSLKYGLCRSWECGSAEDGSVSFTRGFSQVKNGFTAPLLIFSVCSKRHLHLAGRSLAVASVPRKLPETDSLRTSAIEDTFLFFLRIGNFEGS